MSACISWISSGRLLRKQTSPSPAEPAPKRVGSERLPCIAFFTRSSHTPSQFHSLGRRGRLGVPDLLATLALEATGSFPFLDVSAGSCFSNLLHVSARLARHAYHAPWFAAASRGIEFNVSSLSKQALKYLSRSITWIWRRSSALDTPGEAWLCEALEAEVGSETSSFCGSNH